MPTYLVALAVGPFDVVSGGTAGARNTPLRYYAPKGRGAEMRFVKESTPRLVELLEDYFGTPYPYEKLDTVSIPKTVGFGAMENAGMITYSSELVLARPHEETLRFKRRYASSGIHEIAHQWFGNLVTMAWWDDVWLNEAFATWMTHKLLPAYRAEYETGWRRGHGRRYAIESDRLASARRVRNPIVGANDVYGAFDGITYQKGAEVLSMFEAWLGPDRFRQGVRDYLARHAWGNATSTDFFRAVGEASGRSKSAMAAFEGFVEQPGLPLIDMSLRCEGAPSLEVSQQRFRAKGSTAPDMRWTTPACFRYRADGALQVQCEEISNERRTFALAKARACPDWVVGNAGGSGHWVARYDAALARRNSEHVADVPENEAMALASDTSVLVGSGLIPMEDALQLADALLRHPSISVKHGGVELLEKQRDDLLTPAQLKTRHEILARRIQPLARELGWIERADDRDEVRELRVALLPSAARSEGGEALRPQARELALRWIANRESVAAMMVRPILDTAARFADDATYARLEDAMIAAKSSREREDLRRALPKVRNPGSRDRALALALRKARAEDLVDGRDAYDLVEEGLEDEANRGAAFAYVRANWDALVAKLPAETPGHLTTALGPMCTREERAAFADFFKDRAARFQGGPKNYEQTLESIDICIAARGR
jgi:alanyl aminopeptidase